MTENTRGKRTWSDAQLVSAVAASRSWRGVMRELGLCMTSAGSIQVIKRHVIRLGLDTSHFTGQRRWPDAQVKRAIIKAYSWREVFTHLGLLGSGDDRTRVKGHACGFCSAGTTRLFLSSQLSMTSLWPCRTESSGFKSRPRRITRPAGRSVSEGVPPPQTTVGHWFLMTRICWDSPEQLLRAHRRQRGVSPEGREPGRPSATCMT